MREKIEYFVFYEFAIMDAAGLIRCRAYLDASIASGREMSGLVNLSGELAGPCLRLGSCDDVDPLPVGDDDVGVFPFHTHIETTGGCHPPSGNDLMLLLYWSVYTERKNRLWIMVLADEGMYQCAITDRVRRSFLEFLNSADTDSIRVQRLYSRVLDRVRRIVIKCKFADDPVATYCSAMDRLGIDIVFTPFDC